MCEFMLPKRAHVALISIIMIQAELEVSSDLWQSVFTRRTERVNIIYISAIVIYAIIFAVGLLVVRFD
jgi:hypothetical protein